MATFGKDTMTLKIANRANGTYPFPMFLEHDGDAGEAKAALPLARRGIASNVYLCVSCSPLVGWRTVHAC